MLVIATLPNPRMNAPDPKASPPKLALWLVPLLAFVGAMAVAVHEKYVPTGGDPSEPLMVARYWPDLGHTLWLEHGWGYPALIRFFSIFTHDEYASARAVSVLAATAVALCGVRLSFRYLPQFEAWLVCLLIALSPVNLVYGGGSNSDMIMAALLWSAYWLLFMKEVTLFGAAAAGALVMFSIFTKGSGMPLAFIVPVVLLASSAEKRWARASAFAVGLSLCALVFLGMFLVEGMPLRHFLAKGSASIAVGVLDKPGVPRSGDYFIAEYPTMLTLVQREWKAVLSTAGKAVYHIHDRWFLRCMGVLGFLPVAGLFVWVRRWKRSGLGLATCVIAVQATYLWTGPFSSPRHVSTAIPFLTLLSIYALLILPKFLTVGCAAKRYQMPLRRPCLILVCAVTVIWSVHSVTSYCRSADHPRWKAIAEAGSWLKPRATANDRITGGGDAIAYYAGLRAVTIYRVFQGVSPSPEAIAGELQARQCRWLAWIHGVSSFEYPELTVLETTNTFGGCRLVYRNEYVSLYNAVENPSP